MSAKRAMLSSLLFTISIFLNTKSQSISVNTTWFICTDNDLDCFRNTLTCPAMHVCNVNCTGSYACMDSTIDAKSATELNMFVIDPYGDGTFDSATVFCPNNGPHIINNKTCCHLNVVSDRPYPNSVSIYAFEGFNDLSIQCSTSNCFIYGDLFCGPEFNRNCQIDTSISSNSCRSPSPCNNYTLTLSPTANPTQEPTTEPTSIPTQAPTKMPITSQPSISPTEIPSNAPSHDPSKSPTIPTLQPSIDPTIEPTMYPSSSPTTTHLIIPTIEPVAIQSFAPTEFKKLNFICNYNDDHRFIATYLSLTDYAGTMVNAILSSMESVFLLSIDYDHSENHPLASWNRRGITHFIICNLFDIALSNADVECSENTDIQDLYHPNDDTYVAFGMFGIVADNALNEYQQNITNIMTSDEFKNTFNKNMNDRLNNISTNTRRLLPYNSFEVIQIYIIDAMYDAITTTQQSEQPVYVTSTTEQNQVDENNLHQNTDSVATTIIIVLIIVVIILILILVIGVYTAFIKHRQQKQDMPHNVNINIEMNKAQKQRNEGVQHVLTQKNVANELVTDGQDVYDDVDIIKSINQTQIGSDGEYNDQDVIDAINKTQGGNNTDDEIINDIFNTPQ